MSRNISSCGCNPQLQSDEVNVNQNTSPEVVSGGLQIVHATNGRIRIRATEASFYPKLETIYENLRVHEGVRAVSANQQTGSLVVTFDENLLSMPQMLSILQEFDIQQMPVSNVDAFAAWKSPDFWQEQSISLIPLMTGLAVTGGLGISGWAAIPVYMITADATRRVIDYLEPKFSGSDVEKATESSVETGDGLSPANGCYSTVETPLSHNPTLDYTVIHAIPGRIRFNIPRLAQDSAYGRRLEELLKADPQVVKVRVNYDAASIAIAYQPAKVAVTHWVSLMELAGEIHPFQVSSQPNDVMQQNLSNLWADMKYSGMSFSLDYMAKFSLL